MSYWRLAVVIFFYFRCYMQKRILLNFSYIYFIVNFINLPSFKSLKLLSYLQQPHSTTSKDLSYRKLFVSLKSDFLINGGTLSFFFKSINTKFLPVNPYQANFSLTVGLRKIYKGFDTRLMKIKKSFINFNTLYSSLINTPLIPTCGPYFVTSASVNNIKYKNKKWTYIYSGGSFFYAKWYKSFNWFLLKNKVVSYWGSSANTSLRLNKTEDRPPVLELSRILNFDVNCTDTVSKKTIGDELHEIFYNSIYTYFFFFQVIIQQGFSSELFFSFWAQSLYNLETLEDFLYDGFEPATDFDLVTNNNPASVWGYSTTGFTKHGFSKNTPLIYNARELNILSTNTKYYAANRLNTLFIVSFFKLNTSWLLEILFLFFQNLEQKGFFVSIITKFSIVSGFNFMKILNSCKFLELKILQKFEFFSTSFLCFDIERKQESSIKFPINFCNKHCEVLLKMYCKKFAVLSILFIWV